MTALALLGMTGVSTSCSQPLIYHEMEVIGGGSDLLPPEELYVEYRGTYYRPHPMCVCEEQRMGGGADEARMGGAADEARMGGGADEDRMGGAADEDRMGGGADEDRMGGGADEDRMGGGADEDRMGGGADEDRMGGGADEDRMGGGADEDRLGGGADEDRLGGGADEDRMGGGAQLGLACHSVPTCDGVRLQDGTILPFIAAGNMPDAPVLPASSTASSPAAGPVDGDAESRLRDVPFEPEG